MTAIENELVGLVSRPAGDTFKDCLGEVGDHLSNAPDEWGDEIIRPDPRAERRRDPRERLVDQRPALPTVRYISLKQSGSAEAFLTMHYSEFLAVGVIDYETLKQHDKKLAIALLNERSKSGARSVKGLLPSAPEARAARGKLNFQM
jgi:hypothetical protein